MSDKKAPEEEGKYDPEVYKRLELVRKQFQRAAAERKKQESADRRQAYILKILRNKITIGRLVIYVILGALVLAVIGVVVFGFLSR
jgi:hypothetical protein